MREREENGCKSPRNLMKHKSIRALAFRQITSAERSPVEREELETITLETGKRRLANSAQNINEVGSSEKKSMNRTIGSLGILIQRFDQHSRNTREDAGAVMKPPGHGNLFQDRQ